MTTYLWVAIGSALGGMARYWMAAAVMSLTGPQFPWGTILINILGSFIIGFFGMLTGFEGRFAVTPDARVFVMTGLCGGFTTFSAFSLQTFELAHDGRVLSAVGNVVLSVTLCLVAVTLGALAASAINGPAFRGGR
jgi:CrcB protein